jgi:hypothetical protein
MRSTLSDLARAPRRKKRKKTFQRCRRPSTILIYTLAREITRGLGARWRLCRGRDFSSTERRAKRSLGKCHESARHGKLAKRHKAVLQRGAFCLPSFVVGIKLKRLFHSLSRDLLLQLSILLRVPQKNGVSSAQEEGDGEARGAGENWQLMD